MMALTLAVLIVVSEVTVAGAADLVVLCPNALAIAVGRIVEDYGAAGGRRANLVTGTAGGLAERAASGQVADVILGTTAGLADLERRGVLRPASRVEVGVVSVGVAVRKGASPPDVSTSEALRRALLAAKSIGYADPARGGTGGIFFARALEQLGIVDAVRGKTQLFPQGVQALDAVARGEIELAVSPLSEIVVREGLLLAGRLPAELGARLAYSAGVLATSAAPDAARALVERLIAPEGRTALASIGFDPPDAR